jgi:hypothetical protein
LLVSGNFGSVAIDLRNVEESGWATHVGWQMCSSTTQSELRHDLQAIASTPINFFHKLYKRRNS